MRSGWLVLLVVGCHYQSPGSSSPDDANPFPDEMPIDARIDAMPDPEPAARKRVITIQGTGQGDQTDFPVWIRIADDADLKAKTFADGSDLYFTTPSGAANLAFEIERWDKAAGLLEAWVKTDLSDNQTTPIELRYGDPAVANPQDPSQTFSNGFAAVWHFEDDVGATTTVHDSLGLRDGTAVNGPGVANTGALGRGIAFDGTNDEITFANPYTSNNSHTMSAWVKAAAPTAGFSTVIAVGAAQLNDARFLHTRYNSGIGYGWYSNDVLNQTNIDNAFHLVTWVFAKSGNAGNSTVYVDGNVIDTVTHTGMLNTTTTAGHIGFTSASFGPGTTNPLKGTIDEVRLATTTRTAGWVKTEFANQSSPATFFTVGPDVAAD